MISSSTAVTVTAAPDAHCETGMSTLAGLTVQAVGSSVSSGMVTSSVSCVMGWMKNWVDPCGSLTDSVVAFGISPLTSLSFTVTTTLSTVRPL